MIRRLEGVHCAKKAGLGGGRVGGSDKRRQKGRAQENLVLSGRPCHSTVGPALLKPSDRGEADAAPGSHSLGTRVRVPDKTEEEETKHQRASPLPCTAPWLPPPSPRECKSCSHGKSFKHFSNRSASSSKSKGILQ